jgi:NAD(P)H dehydrogenase (quinone)
MTIAVTGATGQLGRYAIEELLKRGAAPAEIVAVVRDPAKAVEWSDRGVHIRTADYAQPSTLATALSGVDKLLMISGSEIGARITQHDNVIAAAEAAGVQLIAYTSVLHADMSGIGLAVEHRATGQRLAASPIPSVVLRNGWYWENYVMDLERTLGSGILFGAGGTGRVAGAARKDYAEAAVAVLIEDGHAGRVYELGGDERLTYAELAAVIAAVSGRPVRYQDLPERDYAAALVAAGLPEPLAATLASSDAGVARGEVDTTSGHLQRLIGRSSTPVAEVIRAAIG